MTQGPRPSTCERQNHFEITQYDLQDELFEHEWEALQELKGQAGSITKYFTDRFIAAALMSRKFDIKRTVKLLKANIKWRMSNNYERLPRWEDLNIELLSDRFANYIPGSRGKDGSGIMYATIRNLVPGKFSKKTFIKDVLEFCLWDLSDGFFYEQMDVFRNGLQVVLDFSEVSMKNIDIGLAKKLNSALLENFPMRISRIWILKPPTVFSAVVSACRIFVKKKIMDRVKIATQEEIQEYIDAGELAAEFGGNLEVTTLNYIEFIRDAVGVKRNEQKRLRRKGEKVNTKKSTKKSRKILTSAQKKARAKLQLQKKQVL